MTGLTFTVLAQIATSLYNQRENRQVTLEIRDFQRKTKEKDLEHSLRRDYEKFLRSCEMQIEMEEIDHRERLRVISEDLNDFIAICARAQTLKHYKLNISPYIIRNKTLPTVNQDNESDRNVFCLLTNSNDEYLSAVLPEIDCVVGLFLSANWGFFNSRHISYYDNTWDRNQPFAEEDITNLKTLFKSIPFISFTPLVSKQNSKCEIVLQTHFWGLNSIDIAIRTSILSYEKESLKILTDSDRNNIITEISRSIVSQIGLLTDLYYWQYFHEAPVFPEIVLKNTSYFGENIINEINSRYKELYSIVSRGLPSNETTNHSQNAELLLLTEVAEMNNINFPERRLSFLNAIKSFYSAEDLSSFSKQAFYEFCTERGIDIKDKTIEEIISENEDLFSGSGNSFLTAFREVYTPHSDGYQRNVKYTVDDFNFTPETYALKRDELIELIDKTVLVPGLSAQGTKDLKALKKKCVENQYNIVLVAQYQAGKSTTFNALCGGREISPRGAMSKTSACKITVSNISEDDKAEYALVHWKTDQELLLNVKEIVERKISFKDLGVNQEHGCSSVLERIVLTNDTHRRLVLKVISEEYEKCILSYKEEDADKKEILQISIIAMKHYSDPQIRELVHRTVFKIEEIGNICVFPSSINNIQKVKAEEAAFAYVNSIECFIHSPHLARLGCSFTDCPGLFASAWDTKVTYESLPEANAVLYLLSGEKQAGKQDVDANLYFHRMNLNDKLFYAINCQKPGKITQNIYQKDQELLGEESIQIFNAQLFFLGNIGKLFIEGQLDKFSKERFNFLADYSSIGKSFEEYWVDMVQTIGNTTKNVVLRDIYELNEDSVNTVFTESHFNDVFDPIEQHIVKGRAYSILIEKGINKLFKELSIVEDLLIRKEQDSYKDAAQCELEYLKALNAFTNFEREVNFLLNDAFSNSTKDAITSDGYDAIVRDTEMLKRVSARIAVEVSSKIREEHKKDALKLRSAIKRAKKKGEKIETLGDLSDKEKEAYDSIKNDITPIIKGIVDNEVRSSVTNWANSIFSGSNDKYKQLVIPELDSLAAKIRRRWKSTLKEDSSLKAYAVTIPDDSVNSFKEQLPNFGEEIRTNDINEQSYQDSVSIAQQAIMDNIIAGIIGSVIYVVFVLMIPIVGLIIAIAILLFLPSIIDKMDGNSSTDSQIDVDDLNKREKKLYYEIFDTMVSQFNDNDTKKKISSTLIKVPETVIELYKAYYKKELFDNRKALEANIDGRRKEREKSSAERIKEAEECKMIRDSIITPLFRQYDQFISSCL